jgi:thiamine-monophosphate kinase
MVHRTGARPGDRVVVTGTIGDAALGLDVLRRGRVAAALAGDLPAREALIGRYRVPQPRNALACALRACAHAAMDVSDGLAGDLAKLCAASGTSAVIDVASIPLSPGAKAALASNGANMQMLISGGDDYEILCAVPEQGFEELARAAGQAGVPVASIGRILAGAAAPQFLDQAGKELPMSRASYSHF